MKRPFAVIGFSMLTSSLLIINLNFKMAVALVIGVMAIFCVLLPLKGMKNKGTVLFSAVAVVIYTISFLTAQSGYYDERGKMKETKVITGVVCQTPTMLDYSFTYIIKCDGKDFKVRLVTEDDKFLSEGDRVRVRFNSIDENSDDDFFEYSLSSKVYFTIFENEESTFEELKGNVGYYKSIGKIKNYFTSVVDEFLPTEAGAIAKAMTIGDRSHLDNKTVDYFNYSGTSHLLVISGLHITMWSLGILRLFERFIKNKRILVALSLFTLFAYSAITGFGVSVIRAGLLVGMVIISKLFDRDADSLNSIGLALVIILVSNPFSVYSVSLWLTVLSTVGILVLSRPLNQLIRNLCVKKNVPVNSFTNFVINSISISLSTTICTLPVFIVKLKMLPIGSVFANLIMVDLALVLMVLTMAGVVLHSLKIVVFSKPIFLLIGIISNVLEFVAEKIGMASWSTISVSHKYFEYFLVILVIGVILAVTLNKNNKNIAKHIAVFLSVTFVLITCYTTSYDYNKPCVEIAFTEDEPVIMVKSRDENLLVGAPEKKYLADIKVMLNTHNEKALDGIFVASENDGTISQLLGIYDYFNFTQTYFYNNAPEFLDSHSEDRVEKITLNGNIKISSHNSSNVLLISNSDKNIIFISCDEENDFKNLEEYDIICLYGKKATEYAYTIGKTQPEIEPRLVVPEINKKMTIYFE